jgi:hypothetical protein
VNTVNKITGAETYRSQLTINGNTFRAEYIFVVDERAAMVAEGGGARALTWNLVAGERIGITIAELGELGGPGFGGKSLLIELQLQFQLRYDQHAAARYLDMIQHVW